MLVIAGAGVFLVFASGTLSEVQIELFSLRFGICCGLDLNHNREVVAFRKGGVGNEDVALFDEFHPGWAGAVATDHCDGLLTDRLRFSVIIDRSDLDFAVIGDKEFEVRFNGMENSTAVGAGFRFRMVVIVVMIVVGSLFVIGAFLFSMVVSIILVMFVVVVIMVMTLFFGTGCAEKSVGRDEYYR